MREAWRDGFVRAICPIIHVEEIIVTNAFKTTYESLPDKISVPDDYVHKRAEVIILLDEDPSPVTRFISEFFGTIPDFPERDEQGRYEIRDSL